MAIKRAIVPQYLENFQCIGSSCEENCCEVGWKVYIDKKAYQKYRKLKNSSIKKLLDQHVKRNRSNSVNDNEYAKINSYDEDKCPFLNDKTQCLIQLTLGEKYLSDSCNNYPRYISEIDGIYQIAMSVSCPEAARIALLDSDGIEFVEGEVDLRDRNLVNFKMDTNGLSNSHHKYYWELRTFTIQILKSRDYELWERLIILGMFYQNIQECIDKKLITTIPKVIQQYTGMIVDGTFKDSLANISSAPIVQIQILKELIDKRCSGGLRNSLYRECLAATLEGLKWQDNGKVEIEEAYRKAYSDYYYSFIQKHGYILENYLVNYVFKNAFPSSGAERVFDNYVMMIFHYSLIQIHLIGMAGFYKENFTHEHVIRLISAFGKTIEQNLWYLDKIKELLKENKLDNMTYMTILIKN